MNSEKNNKKFLNDPMKSEFRKEEKKNSKQPKSIGNKKKKSII